MPAVRPRPPSSHSLEEAQARGSLSPGADAREHEGGSSAPGEGLRPLRRESRRAEGACSPAGQGRAAGRPGWAGPEQLQGPGRGRGGSKRHGPVDMQPLRQ